MSLCPSGIREWPTSVLRHGFSERSHALHVEEVEGQVAPSDVHEAGELGGGLGEASRGQRCRVDELVCPAQRKVPVPLEAGSDPGCQLGRRDRPVRFLEGVAVAPEELAHELGVLVVPAALPRGQHQRRPEAHQVDDRLPLGAVVEVCEAVPEVRDGVLLEVGVPVQVHIGELADHVREGVAGL